MVGTVYPPVEHGAPSECVGKDRMIVYIASIAAASESRASSIDDASVNTKVDEGREGKGGYDRPCRDQIR